MTDVIRLEDVVKRYRLGIERSNLRTANPWRRPDPVDDTANTVTALDHVDLTVDEGEVLGVIGNNGTGKSTMLKLIAGVVSPTGGKVSTRGRIASLIELGVGFHDDLTGYENLEFTGALMGMSPAEVRRRRDEIIEFSGIGYAIHTPVKRYSSGMLARLGFSVATHVDADIILVDEVLAVGDIDFQRISLKRLENLIYDGVTTVLVSHHLAAVAYLCSRVLRLDRGRLIANDDPQKVIRDYGGRMAVVNAGLGRVPVKLKYLKVTPQEVDPAKPFDIEGEIEVEQPLQRGRLRLVLRPTAELVAMATNQTVTEETELTQLLDLPVPADMLTKEGTWRLRGHVEKFPMFPGSYTFSLELLEDPHPEILDAVAAIIRIPGATSAPAPLSLPVTWGVDPLDEVDSTASPAGER